jgi:hypothetical protein
VDLEIFLGEKKRVQKQVKNCVFFAVKIARLHIAVIAIDLFYAMHCILCILFCAF